MGEKIQWKKHLKHKSEQLGTTKNETENKLELIVIREQHDFFVKTYATEEDMKELNEIFKKNNIVK